MERAKFPNFKQHKKNDCGPCSLLIISRFYGMKYSFNYLKRKFKLTGNGVTLSSISSVAKSIGFTTVGVKIKMDKLQAISFPCIVHWLNNHFIVVYKITSKYAYVSDPAVGLIKYSILEFAKGFTNNNVKKKKEGIVLIFSKN